MKGCVYPLHRSERERERGTERERKREGEGEREKEGGGEREICRIFLKGMTGALAPFSYLVAYKDFAYKDIAYKDFAYKDFAYSIYKCDITYMFFIY